MTARSRSPFPPRGDAVMPPGATPLARALGDSAPLARLAARLQESTARFAAVQEVLPPALRAQVLAGPVDEQAWTLLARNPAVAAKLRHLLPSLEQRLREAGWPPLAVQVRVMRV